MRSTLILAAIAALVFASAADAKSCKDAAGHFAKCPPATAAPATPAATAKAQAKTAKANAKASKAAAKKAATKVNKATAAAAPAPAAAPAKTATATGGAPHCKTGKPCGKACISQDKVCHK